MSISRTGIFSAAVFLFPLATLAQTANTAWTILPPYSEDVHVTNFTLSESDTRRLSHYAAQALAAIYELEAASPEDSGSIETLRYKIARLTDAGTRCGYNTAQTAEFFQSYVDENLRGPLPPSLTDNAGNLEALQLLVSVEAYYLQSSPKVVDVAAVMAEDLQGLKTVTLGAAVSQPAPGSLQLSFEVLPDEATNTLQGPFIPENADTDIRAVLSRVEVANDTWAIEIRQGDTLATIAYALFGDRLRFNDIYDLNRDVLRSPNLLTVGQVLVLPQNG